MQEHLPGTSANHPTRTLPRIQICNDDDGDQRLPVILYGRNHQLETFAIFDEGSSIALIDVEVAANLQLEGPQADLSVQWFGNQTTVERSQEVLLKIRGASNQYCHEIHNVRTINVLKLPTQSVDPDELKNL